MFLYGNHGNHGNIAFVNPGILLSRLYVLINQHYYRKATYSTTYFFLEFVLYVVIRVNYTALSRSYLREAKNSHAYSSQSDMIEARHIAHQRA
jgi:hypothetical protein